MPRAFFLVPTEDPVAGESFRGLTRAERIAKLTDTERFTPGRSPLGLLKVANRLVVAAKKPKKEAAEGEAGAEAGAAAGATAAAAPAAKAASAAKGGAAKK